MLGRLAHWLRAMGYDTLYLGPAEDDHLLRVAATEDRILVTRDGRLAQLAGARGCLIRADDVARQLQEVVEKLALSPPAENWLSRCLECNAPVERRAKETVEGLVPARIFATQIEFWGCPSCRKIYWLGSHAERILTELGRILGRTER